MLRKATAALFISVATVWMAASAALTAAASSATLQVSMPRAVDSGASAALTVTLPSNVAAVDGRVYFDTSAAEVVGVSATKHGTALDPQQFSSGYAFGVYGMHGTAQGQVTISVATVADGQLPFRIVLDAAGDASGNRISLAATSATGTLQFGTATTSFAAPAAAAPQHSLNPVGLTRDLVGDGRIGVKDLDIVRAGWDTTHADNNSCSEAAVAASQADANGDGCIDILDVQAVLAHQSWNVVNGLAVSPDAVSPDAASGGSKAKANVTAGLTFVVNSNADAADANPGDGVCADSQGRCTLRAAITEANWASGANTIDFNISGTAPITIQLSSSLPTLLLQDRSGGTLIDGYSQPGAKANTAQYGSNAVPGIFLVGVGSNGFRVTSASNTIRGFITNNFDRSIVLDGTDSNDNVIAGNWLNFNANGTPASTKQHYNVWIDNGASYNHVGTSALADRNLSGNSTKGAALYGPGTNYNQIQGNDFCMTPSGTATATCDVGTDFSFGPKYNLIGGTDPGDGNVYGASTQQCIEFAHDNEQKTDHTWMNDYNSIVDNWLGFRADGSYSSAFRCGSNAPSNSSNDSNGINLADGTNWTTVQGNYIGSWHDGVNIEMPDEQGNLVKNNTIGISPQGQAAPMDRYGVNIRVHAHDHQIVGNTIANAGVYGVSINTSDSVHITISQNIITDMTGAAINLVSGANGGILPPVIGTAGTIHVSGTGGAGDTVEVFKASLNAGQSGLPIAYVGSAVVGSNGQWTASVTGIKSGDEVTATQTRSAGGTSALSKNVTAQTETAPPPGTIATDAFGRTVNNGWGSADFGGSYTIQGAATNYSVGSGVGTMSLGAGASRSALLNSTSVDDTDVVFRVATNKVAAGGSFIAYAAARKNGTNEYRAKLIFNQNGTILVSASKLVNNTESSLGTSVVVSGLNQTAGNFIWVHAQFKGSSPTTVRVRAWADGTSEPSSWQFSATDSAASLQGSGSVGLRAWLGSPETAGTVTFSFDDYSVTDLTP